MEKLYLVFRLAGLVILIFAVFYAFNALLNQIARMLKQKKREEYLHEAYNPGRPVAQTLPAINRRFSRDMYAFSAHFFLIAGYLSGLIAHLPFPFNLSLFSLGALLLIVGSLMFILRRLISIPRRFTRRWTDLLPLFLLLLLGLSGMAYAYVLLYNITGVVLIVARFLHVAVNAALLITIPRTKMAHFITMHFVSVTGERGRLKNNLTSLVAYSRGEGEAGIEEQENFGLKSLAGIPVEFWKDVSACMECGRCSEVCPAVAMGKTLSPRVLIGTFKHLLLNYPQNKDLSLIDLPGVKQSILDCYNCYACENACPSFVSIVDTIVDLRRHLVLDRAEAEEMHREVLKRFTKSASPIELNTAEKKEFIRKQDLPLFGSGGESRYLLWLGCHTYVDPAFQALLTRLCSLLDSRGMKYGVIDGELCCGDPARRIGDEAQFLEIMLQNLKHLQERGVEKIITVCAHCFHSLAREYPTFGLKVEVMHYTDFLNTLPPPRGKVADSRVYYHKSCYLSRFSSQHSQSLLHLKHGDPRTFVSLKVPLGESMCCGAGGGHYYLDEKIEQRPAARILEQLKAKKVDKILTACPYCQNMFTDTIKVLNYDFEVNDVITEYTEEKARG